MLLLHISVMYNKSSTCISLTYIQNLIHTIEKMDHVSRTI